MTANVKNVGAERGESESESRGAEGGSAEREGGESGKTEGGLKSDGAKCARRPEEHYGH